MFSILYTILSCTSSPELFLNFCAYICSNNAVHTCYCLSEGNIYVVKGHWEKHYTQFSQWLAMSPPILNKWPSESVWACIQMVKGAFQYTLWSVHIVFLPSHPISHFVMGIVNVRQLMLHVLQDSTQWTLITVKTHVHRSTQEFTMFCNFKWVRWITKNTTSDTLVLLSVQV